ncbi:hypothetical protein HD806DRAFT_543206 [Xylariaceae sp. AK1471]|nr:hypothetical protein HD806DRAFT_543206 [Xylariaceae sp. AK1471]
MLRRPPTTLTLTAEDVAAYEDRRYAQLQAQAQAQAQTRAHAQAQVQAQLQLQSQSKSRQLRGQHAPPHPSAMDTSTSSPTNSMDEAMEDAVASNTAAAALNEDEDEEEDEDDDDDDDEDDPFTTQHHIRRAAIGPGRAVSPGAQRGVYVRQIRARGGHHAQGHARSQSHTHASSTSIPTSTSAYNSTATSRAQRIMGSASASALPSAVTSGSGSGLGISGQVPAHLQQTPVQNVAPTATRAGTGRGGRQTSEPPPAPARVTRSRDERIGIAAGARPDRWHSDLAAHGQENDWHIQTQTESEAETQETPATVVRRIQPVWAQTGTHTSIQTGMQASFQEQETPRQQLDGQVEDENEQQSTPETVYAADLQVVEETPSAESVEAGSPLPSQHRRRFRSHTMRLRSNAARGVHTPTHTRGSSDTTTLSSSSTLTGMGMGVRRGFTSINTRRAHGDDYALGYSGNDRENGERAVGEGGDYRM